jgi:hypothetical protein
LSKRSIAPKRLGYEAFRRLGQPTLRSAPHFQNFRMSPRDVKAFQFKQISEYFDIFRVNYEFTADPQPQRL